MDKFWIFLRQNDAAYIANKLISFTIAGGFAYATASHKPMLQKYTIEQPLMDNVNAYNFLYWLLFIYYSFAALDELLELYRSYFKVPKSSIGLLFELNYFLGAGIMMYIGWFASQHMMTVPAAYKPIEEFLNFQIKLLYIMGAVTVFMWTCFCCMQRKITREERSDAKVSSGY